MDTWPLTIRGFGTLHALYIRGANGPGVAVHFRSTAGREVSHGMRMRRWVGCRGAGYGDSGSYVSRSIPIRRSMLAVSSARSSLPSSCLLHPNRTPRVRDKSSNA